MKRVSLLALGLALVSTALVGCSSSGAEHPISDGGASSTDLGELDLGFTVGSDLGVFVNDGGAPVSLTVKLVAPTPLASAVHLDQTLDFEVSLGPGVTQSQSETWIAIAPRKLPSSALSGGYAWKPSMTGGVGAYSLHFIPSSPLTDGTDYVVHVDDQHGFPYLRVLSTGFSTGSRPRATSATLRSTNGGAQVWIDFTFSEPMDAATVAPGTRVTVGPSAVAGTVSTQTNATYRFNFTGGAPAMAGAVSLWLSTAIANQADTVALFADDWDSPTAGSTVDGGADRCQIDFPSGIVLTQDTSYAWMPIVN